MQRYCIYRNVRAKCGEKTTPQKNENYKLKP